MSIRNSVSLIGNVGQDPTVTTFESGTVLTEFSLATNETFRDRKGDRQTRTAWHKIKAFGKPAEVLGQWLNKGSQVAIEGRLHYNKWTDKHQQPRISTEIIVEDFTFLSSRGEAQKTRTEAATQNQPDAAPVPAMTLEEPPAPTPTGRPASQAPRGRADGAGKKRRPKPSVPDPTPAAVATGAQNALSILEHDELPF